MPRLNDQFMEALTNPDGKLKVERTGYQIGERTEIVEIRLNPWLEAGITVSGELRANLLKGGIALEDYGPSKTFAEGGLHEKGLHMGFSDEYGDRKYWITDADDEEVQVAFWDPNANTPDPQDGTPGGQYGEWSSVPEEDVEVVKEIARGIIEAARIAVDSQLAAS